MIKLEGEVKVQTDLQKRLLEQLEGKYLNLMNLEEQYAKSDELAYDLVDTFNVEDMKDKIDTLENGAIRD